LVIQIQVLLNYLVVQYYLANFYLVYWANLLYLKVLTI
uniref:NADH dehydrogenase subunit 4 n=1 Tax=Brugia timori TaxID=42155 RepID=A0A0R3QBC7_9BILA